MSTTFWGRDFVEVLTERVRRCDALIAVIGRNWVASADKDNRRRIDDPDDFVRIEIEAALKREVRVIPVLVDGAPMPKANDLPESLRKLARRQRIEISHTSFDADVERLTDVLGSIDWRRVYPTAARIAAECVAGRAKVSGGFALGLIAATALVSSRGGDLSMRTRRIRGRRATEEKRSELMVKTCAS